MRGPRHACLLLTAVSLLACGDEAQRGALVVRVESDLALPKDLDLVRVEVTRRGQTLLAKERDLFDPQSRLLEFSIPADGDLTPVRARAVGYKHGEAIVERRAITPLPRSQKLLLTLPLRYLCSGKQAECQPDETCDQGRCTSAVVRSESLLEYDASSDLPYGRPDANAGDCMNVVECFAGASAPAVDPASCSFPMADDVESKSLNVALRFSRDGSGVCGSDACFIALDAGDDGWSLIEGSVQLPSEVCRESAPFTVVYSTECATKTSATSICWEPPSAALASTGTDARPESAASVPPAIGTSCEPPAVESCGMCGARTRTCRGGQWSEWSECFGTGLCEPNAQQGCENRGTRVCRADCQWGECEGQRCDGPDTQSCGDCGARHRTCANGKWSEWSACGEQGQCTPNAVQACQPEGSQACGGNCAWDACTVQACSGVASQACGRCGTQRRTCDASTGAWSEWGECAEQGECAPDETKACGESGHNTCLGNCTWDPVCRDQVCTGPTSMPCEKCGTQTRTCDPQQGVWTAFRECGTQGECAPNETRSCQQQGVESCNASCHWSGTCTGQVCTGEKERACDRCGKQTRECDASAGAWGAWSSCTNQGACAPGEMGVCGTDGVRTCGTDCRWGACAGQSCREPLEESCERCGTRRRTCDASTGKVSEWSACLDQGRCEPGEMGACGNGGMHACTQTCQWPAECHNQPCDVPATQSCDRCGTERSTCNGDTGVPTWSSCLNQGECSPNQSDVCGGTGRKACSSACSWSACDCGAGSVLCGDACTNVQTDPNNCGGCGRPCKSGESCSAGQCVAPDCVPPTSRCNMVCLNLESDPDHCGSCTNSCPRPSSDVGRPTCTKRQCGVECNDLTAAGGPKLTACGAECVDLLTDQNNCGECGMKCQACAKGKCPDADGGMGVSGAGAGGAGSSGAGAGGAGSSGAGAGGAGSSGAGAGGAGSSGAGAGGAGAGGAGSSGAGAGGAGSSGAGAGGAGMSGAVLAAQVRPPPDHFSAVSRH